MANIYTEIDDIKKHGSVYDNKISARKILEESKKNNPLYATASDWSNVRGYQFGDEFYAEPKLGVGNLYPEGFGKSQYDESAPNWRTFEDKSLNQFRYENQPWYDVLGNRIGNFASTTATTFVTGLLGSVAGVLQGLLQADWEGLFNGEIGDFGRTFGHGFTNNFVSEGMYQLNNAAKEAMTSYHSDQYNQNMQDGKWWNSLFSKEWGSFLGENLFEQAGFTAGMVFSGMATGGLAGLATAGRAAKAIDLFKTAGQMDKVNKLLKGAQPLSLGLTGELASAAKTLQLNQSIARWAGNIQASFGEALQESLQTQDQFRQNGLANIEAKKESLLKNNIKNLYEQNPNLNDRQLYEQALILTNQQTEDAKAELEKNTQITGNMNFLLNSMILLPTNNMAWSKLFEPSVKGTKAFRAKISNLTGETANKVSGELGKLTVEGAESAAKSFYKNPLFYKALGKQFMTEGGQEFLQGGAGTASEYYGAYNYNQNTLEGLKMDIPSANEITGLWSAIANGFIDNFSNADSYLEFLIGGIMGSTGMINVSRRQSADGKKRLFSGGAWEEYIDNKNAYSETQALVEQANKIFNDPKYQELTKGFVRHVALNNASTEAMKRDDLFAAENAEDLKFINSLIAFTKLGKTQDFLDNMDSIVKNYQNILDSNNQKDIDEAANGIREIAKNEKTGKSIYDEIESKDVLKYIIENNKDLLGKANSYLEIANNLKMTIGDKFDGSHLEELTLMFWNVENLENRATKVADSLVNRLSNLKQRGLSSKKFEIKVGDEMQKLTMLEIINGFKSGSISGSEISTMMLDSSRMKQNKQFNEKQGDYIRSLLVANYIKANPTTKANLLKDIETLGVNDVVDDLIGIAQIEDVRSAMVNTYNYYTNNPSLIKSKIDEDVANANKQLGKLQERTLKQKFAELKESDGRTLEDVRQLVEENNKNKGLQNIIDELSNKNLPSYNKLVDDYRNLEHAKNTFKLMSKGSKHHIFINFIRNLANKATSYQDFLDKIKKYIDDNNDTIDLDENRRDNLTESDLETKRNLIIDFYNDLIKQGTVHVNPQKLTHDPESVNTPGQDRKVEDTIYGSQNQDEIHSGNESIRDGIDEKSPPTPEINPDTNQLSEDPWRWNSGFHFIDINEYKVTHIISLMNKWVDGIFWKPTFNYLTSKGVDKYVNEGNIQIGDKIKLFASTKYWNYLKSNGLSDNFVDNAQWLLYVKEVPNKTEYTEEIDGKHYQIVGTYNKVLNVDLHTKVLADMKSSGNTEFVSEHGTEIAYVTPGRLEFTKDLMRDVNSIMGKTSWGTEIKFKLGISEGSPNVDTNDNSASYSLVQTPESKGALFMMIPSATGVDIPTWIRIKSIKDVYQDLIDNKDKPIFKELRKTLSELIHNGQNNDKKEFDKSISDLRNILWIGSGAGVPMNLRMMDGKEPVIQFGNVTEEIHPAIRLQNEDGTKRLPSDIINEIYKAFSTLDVRFNVQKSEINKGNYNQKLLDSNLLETDLKYGYVQGGYFFTKQIGEKQDGFPLVDMPLISKLGWELDAKRAERLAQQGRSKNENPVGAEESVKLPEYEINGKKYTIDNKGIVYDLSNNVIKDALLISLVRGRKYYESSPERQKRDAFENEGRKYYINSNIIMRQDYTGIIPNVMEIINENEDNLSLPMQLMLSDYKVFRQQQLDKSMEELDKRKEAEKSQQQVEQKSEPEQEFKSDEIQQDETGLIWPVEGKKIYSRYINDDGSFAYVQDNQEDLSKYEIDVDTGLYRVLPSAEVVVKIRTNYLQGNDYSVDSNPDKRNILKHIYYGKAKISSNGVNVERKAKIEIGDFEKVQPKQDESNIENKSKSSVERPSEKRRGSSKRIKGNSSKSNNNMQDRINEAKDWIDDNCE